MKTGSSIVFDQFIRQLDRFPGQQGGQRDPEGIGGGRATLKEVIDFDHLVAGINLVQDQGQIRIVGILPGGVIHRGPISIRLIEALFKGDGISQGRDASANGAFADGDEDVAMVAEINQVSDIFLIATAAFDQAHRATSGELLEVIDGGLVEINEFDQVEDAFVNVEE